MPDKEDILFIEKGYICRYCKPATKFNKVLKAYKKTGLLKEGQGVTCPSCSNMLPVRGYKNE